MSENFLFTDFIFFLSLDSDVLKWSLSLQFSPETKEAGEGGAEEIEMHKIIIPNTNIIGFGLAVVVGNTPV